MKFASALFALLLAGGSLAPSLSLAQSYPVIDVKVDRAKVMRVSRPAAMIIIGNPAIADATIKDSQTLIITGKQYGSTNLIVLDAEGEPIADELLNVSAANENSVTVYKGVTRQTLNCAPDCSPVYRMGDEEKHSVALAQQIETYKRMSKGEQIEIDGNE
ncbi:MULTISPECIES: pilus assembly protein N-terminal domain-containing protein [Cohaesibacter]|uniref:pilus assembly protein N-terminal domain-containing protein n=1 Tax=Cohaesibacter TaxID=655352 RepID=UPI000DEA1AD5|nr:MULTISPECIES: pilus assembly protein N-terminal domain-containing protein [Cohaesibacter]TLP46003.1 pilus assembly protein [Cohaesibacter sp. CAU 1516]